MSWVCRAPPPAPVLVLASFASLCPRLARPRRSSAPVPDRDSDTDRQFFIHQRDADATRTPSNTTRHSRDSENPFVEQ